jgi:hypothetical protein
MCSLAYELGQFIHLGKSEEKKKREVINMQQYSDTEKRLIKERYKLAKKRVKLTIGKPNHFYCKVTLDCAREAIEQGLWETAIEELNAIDEVLNVTKPSDEELFQTPKELFRTPELEHESRLHALVDSEDFPVIMEGLTFLSFLMALEKKIKE